MQVATSAELAGDPNVVARAEAVDFAYNAAGATAIFENHPLERRFRDIHTVTQQLQGQFRHFETVGAWMMGAEADLTFV
jgi:acyl-CoA dehydrogenase-like protein